ncbi:MAG: preprotein translocase subunit SecA [Gaiellales bacterium]|nr:preprotein translocase subunit SecA [Gaiellales bacterium]MDX6598830.1 preprotein translocase subunit SecA [Gaiellales bacterium]
MSLIDTGWAAWLPFELTAALEALSGGSPARRAFRQQLAAERDAASRERWERFRLVAPSRVDVPIDGDGLTEDDCYALLEGLGLVEGTPPRPVEPESVELVLTLDEDDRRELDRIRAARDAGAATTPTEALPSLKAAFGGGDVGRNDPCPCGSGQKFKRCHGR